MVIKLRYSLLLLLTFITSVVGMHFINPSFASSLTNSLGFAKTQGPDFGGDTNQQDLIATIEDQAPDLRPQVLKAGLLAYKHGRQQGMDQEGIITVVDYTLPSTEKRMWVIDLKHEKVLYHTLVAHGKGSGGNYATKFSDKPETHASSVGVYETEQPYHGKHGLALRLKGLEQGFNDNAYARDIVIHSAAYVSKAFANAHDRLGRSWGCLALNKHISSDVINTIKDGTLIVAYYPLKSWLAESNYLQPMV